MPFSTSPRVRLRVRIERDHLLDAAVDHQRRDPESGRPESQLPDRRLLAARPGIRQATIAAATETTAVPWTSSCITGCGSASISRRSISKHSGAEMSSRWMPPNVRAIRTTVSTKASTSGLHVDQHRHRRDPGELAVEHGLALHHRHRRDRPDVPEPEYPRPVRADRDAARDHRVAGGERGSAAIARHTRATPGVYTSRISCTVRTGWIASISSLPPSLRISARSWCQTTPHAVDRIDQRGDRTRLIGVSDLDRDLADRVLASDRDRDDVADQPLPLRDRPRDARELSCAVRDLNPVGAVEHAATLTCGAWSSNSCSRTRPVRPRRAVSPRSTSRRTPPTARTRSPISSRAPTAGPRSPGARVSSATTATARRSTPCASRSTRCSSARRRSRSSATAGSSARPSGANAGSPAD